MRLAAHASHLASRSCSYLRRESAMFKISVVESRGQRKLILEGKLISPWTAEVEKAWRNAGEALTAGS